MDEGLQAEFDRRNLADQVNEKVWRIPAYEGRGPVTMKLLLPELTITDSDGRFIVISPRQSAVLGSRLETINDWLQYCDGDGECDE
ncbi:MAG TPA: hypothetical protein VGR06_05410 [Actinophytocola sp.]|uniref:hypothetical protein n=1 Tax=Actinophytocola sp. TaxID=1872138 RepID=UPI002E0C2CCB|nr:hypothetical protein [Actinophytocola sp.]